MSSSWRDFGLAALGAFLFGTTILFNRAVARDGLHSSVALGIRFTVAGVLLLGLLAFLRRPLLPPEGERITAIGLGLVFYTVEATAFYMALERGTAAAVALIFYAYPAVIAVTEVALGRSAMSSRTIGALLLALGGSAIVAIGGGDVAITTGGIVFICCSIALFSSYVIISDRLLVQTDSITAATWTALGAAAGTTLWGVLAGEWKMPSGDALAALIANGCATAGAFALFFIVLGRIGATRTAIVMALEAVFGVVLSAVFLDESLKAIVALGGTAVLAGAVLAALSTPEPVEQLEAASSP